MTLGAALLLSVASVTTAVVHARSGSRSTAVRVDGDPAPMETAADEPLTTTVDESTTNTTTVMAAVAGATSSVATTAAPPPVETGPAATTWEPGAVVFRYAEWDQRQCPRAENCGTQVPPGHYTAKVAFHSAPSATENYAYGEGVTEFEVRA